MTATPMILAGDIGGTKTILALYSGSSTSLTRIAEETFASSSHKDLESILDTFRKRHPETIHAAAFAVAGPIVQQRATVTNLPWTIDSEALAARFGVPRVVLLNDLEALAKAIPHLPRSSFRPLSEGHSTEQGAMAVVAPGTGLGEAYLVWTGREYLAHPSEGGHTDFAPIDPLQIRLLEFMWKEHPRVSVERVCSGSGLPNLYRFLRDGEGHPEEASIAKKLGECKDPTPVIIDAAIHETCSLCRRTLELFVQILGAEVGNLALKTLSTGGIYLGGGIPPRILSFLDSDLFLEALRAKGRFRSLVSDIPIHVILDRHAVLHGAALHGLADQPDERLFTT